MIRGIDIGNYATKDDLGNIFESKVSFSENMLYNKYEMKLNNEIYYLGEGSFDTEYQKVKKETYIKLLFGALCLSSKANQENFEIVLGLPLSQYKKDKGILKSLIKENYCLKGSINNIDKEFYITDCEVFPEGLAAVNNTFEGVVVDIGGRTTDCCLTYLDSGRRKIENPMSLPMGTINLYSDFIKSINNKFSLDLTINDAERILKKGLKVNGEAQNINFGITYFKEYLENLIKQLNIEYSLKSNNITFTGGGSLILKNSILKRVPYATISDTAEFDNAKGFYKVGVNLWG